MESILPQSNYETINDPEMSGKKKRILKWTMAFIAMFGLIGLVLYFNSNNNKNINNNSMIINGEMVQTPTCNYAATAAYFYPIGGCETEKNVDEDTGEITISSFKYRCHQKRDVYKLTYDTEKCKGKYVTATKVNDDLLSFKCDAKRCTIAHACSLTGCIENDNCSQCTKYKNKDTISKQCRPYIIGQCFGNPGGLLQKNSCNPTKKLLTESFYSGDSCTPATKIFSDKLGSKNPKINCKHDAFTIAKC